MIHILSRQKGVHGSDIAAKLGVSRPTVSVALKALEKEGYLYMDHILFQIKKQSSARKLINDREHLLAYCRSL